MSSASNSLLHAAAGAMLASCLGLPAHAEFDPSRVLVEPEAVAQRYPDPDVRYDTPGFREGRTDFASHAEVLDWLRALAARSPHVKIEIIGRSQEGRPMPLVLLAERSRWRATRPTVLILGQQHGNEPAGGEAALALAERLATTRTELLSRINVLIVPRANPDGAEHFTRVTASGIDVNRDHLLLQTPEARAIASATLRYRPQVALDLHEFTVGGRWVDKFGVMEKYDALLQAASVANLHPGLALFVEREYVQPLFAMFTGNGLAAFPYHTTSTSPGDKVVSMGGVQPDTGRNIGGLRPGISLLLEVRGVGIGRAHFVRRVHTQVLAAMHVVETAARHGSALVEEVERSGMQVANAACRGDTVIAARHTATRQSVTFVDAVSGDDKPIEVDWRAATPLEVVRARRRPCGYLIAGSAREALARLRMLGVRVQRVKQSATWRVERYAIVREKSGQRQDARGAIEDAAPLRDIEVRVEAARERIPAGRFYVPLAQPAAGLVGAALEPDSQNSYAANRVLDLEASELRRVIGRPPGDALSHVRAHAGSSR